MQHATKVVDTHSQRRSLASLRLSLSLSPALLFKARIRRVGPTTSVLFTHQRVAWLAACLPPAASCRCLLDCQEFPRTLIATSQRDKEIPSSGCSFITPFMRCSLQQKQQQQQSVYNTPYVGLNTLKGMNYVKRHSRERFTVRHEKLVQSPPKQTIFLIILLSVNIKLGYLGFGFLSYF